METNGVRLALVKEVGGNRFAGIDAQLVPGVALGENVMGKTLRHKTTVTFLRHAEHEFHVATMIENLLENKPAEWRTVSVMTSGAKRE